MIPPIFHRVWLGTSPLPEEFQRYGETWLHHHPGWEMRLWTEDNLPEVCRTEILDRLRTPAERADMLRYELLYRFGGIYVDTDIECLRSIEPLLEGIDFCTAYNTPGYANNAFIGSVADHPILKRAVWESTPRVAHGYDKAATGPVFFTGLLSDFPDAMVFDVGRFYTTAEQPGHGYVVHHEAQSWKSPSELTAHIRTLQGRIKRSRDKNERLSTRLEAAERRAKSAERDRKTAVADLKALERSAWWRLGSLLRRPARTARGRRDSRTSGSEGGHV